MAKAIFKSMAVLLLPLALFLAGCGPKEDAASSPPASDGQGGGAPSTGPAAGPAAEPSTGPADLGPLQERLAAAGFQVPRSPTAAPDFELESLRGGRVSLRSFQGRVVFLNFWATWCPPCRAEMPSMQALYTGLGSRDFEIVAVDLQEGKAEVQGFVQENGLTFPVLLDSTGQVGQAYSVRNIPTSYLLDRKGNVVARWIGGRDWNDDESRALIEELLRQ